MKYLVRKIINGSDQYYMVLQLRLSSGLHRIQVSKYIGPTPPPNPRADLTGLFEAAARRTAQLTDSGHRTPFRPDSIKTTESARFWHLRLDHELFMGELHDFRTAFFVLFTLNSNRAEGSKLTRPDIENVMRARTRPQSALDVEIASSMEAMNIAFSGTMKWSPKGVRELHATLLKNLQPAIAGRFRKVAVMVGAGTDPVTSATVPWKEVPEAMRSLMKWLDATRRKRTYPPWVATEFHWRFERIHPFEDGNGRIGRILMNAILQHGGFMPVFFDARNTVSYSNALGKAMKGHPQTFASFFADQTARTQKAVEEYSAAIRSIKWARRPGPWKEPRGKLLVYDDPGSISPRYM
jgi:fido (protein-threonine AMPylation protein)